MASATPSIFSEICPCVAIRAGSSPYSTVNRDRSGNPARGCFCSIRHIGGCVNGGGVGNDFAVGDGVGAVVCDDLAPDNDGVIDFGAGNGGGCVTDFAGGFVRGTGVGTGIGGGFDKDEVLFTRTEAKMFSEHDLWVAWALAAVASAAAWIEHLWKERH